MTTALEDRSYQSGLTIAREARACVDCGDGGPSRVKIALRFSRASRDRAPGRGCICRSFTPVEHTSAAGYQYR
ncbi:MAG TPA: hypothetical protein VFE65_26050 [Pseudonocardia sp.]|jgi:hypothetical protein|nr:hypothetical protein [Pseudonocardia sp.]